MANWLWKFIKNRKKNAYEIADWILSQTDKVIKKVLPAKSCRAYRIVKTGHIMQRKFIGKLICHLILKVRI